jgi:hypothetical protein
MAVRHGLLMTLCIVALLGLGGARASAQSSDTPGIVVYTASFGRDSVAAFVLDTEQPAASVEVRVPSGYGVASAAAGAEIGLVSVALTDAKHSDSALASGTLVVDDQAAAPGPTDDCAPGRHVARWHVDLGLVGREPLRFFFYVDTGAPAGADAAVLRFCPVWQGGAAPAVVAEYVSVFLENQTTEPASPGVETWRAVVEPGAWVGDMLVPKSGSTFELRSLVAHPHTLTLSASYDAPRKTAVLTGRLLAVGRPEPGVAVELAALTDGTNDFSSYPRVITNATGEFTVRHRVAASTTFTASVEPIFRACQEPSTAAGGCLSETISSPASVTAHIHVRGKREARLVPRARDQALARRGSIHLEDFPAGWLSIGSSDFSSCPGFQPDLSKLTVGGEAASPFFIAPDENAGAWSSTEVYATEKQAQFAFSRIATIAAAQCVAKEEQGDDVTVVSVGTRKFARVGETTRAFRIAFSSSDGSWYDDLVYVRRGRTLLRIGFIADVDLTSLETTLARAVAARGH